MQYKTAAALEKLHKDKNLSRNIKLYKTIIKPVIIYGCEAWTIPIKHQIKLLTFENRILKNMWPNKRYSEQIIEKVGRQVKGD